MYLCEDMVGREVLTRNHVKGRISRYIIDTSTDYPVEVTFMGGSTLRYTETGRYMLANISPEDLIWVEPPPDNGPNDSLEYFRKKMGFWYE